MKYVLLALMLITKLSLATEHLALSTGWFWLYRRSNITQRWCVTEYTLVTLFMLRQPYYGPTSSCSGGQ